MHKIQNLTVNSRSNGFQGTNHSYLLQADSVIANIQILKKLFKGLVSVIGKFSSLAGPLEQDLNVLVLNVQKLLCRVLLFSAIKRAHGYPQAQGPLEVFDYFALFKHRLETSTVGYVWNFQIGGGCKSAIFQFSKLKFDMVLYFGLINSPTLAKIFYCKNGFSSLICMKVIRDTVLKTICQKITPI